MDCYENANGDYFDYLCYCGRNCFDLFRIARVSDGDDDRDGDDHDHDHDNGLRGVRESVLVLHAVLYRWKG